MWPCELKLISLRGLEKSNADLYMEVVDSLMDLTTDKSKLNDLLQMINSHFLNQGFKRLLIDEDAVMVHEKPWFTSDIHREYQDFTVHKYALPYVKNELKGLGESAQLMLRRIQFFTFTGVPSFLKNVKHFSYIGLCSCGIPDVDELPSDTFIDPLNEAFDTQGHITAIETQINKAIKFQWTKPDYTFEEKYDIILPNKNRQKHIKQAQERLKAIVQNILENMTNIDALLTIQSDCQTVYRDIKHMCVNNFNDGLTWQSVHDLQPSTEEEQLVKQRKQGEILGQVVCFGGCIRIAYVLQCALHIHIMRLKLKTQVKVSENKKKKVTEMNELAGKMKPPNAPKNVQPHTPVVASPRTDPPKKVENTTSPKQPEKKPSKKKKEKKKEKKTKDHDSDDEFLEEQIRKVAEEREAQYRPGLAQALHVNLIAKLTSDPDRDEILQAQIEKEVGDEYLKNGYYVLCYPIFKEHFRYIQEKYNVSPTSYEIVIDTAVEKVKDLAFDEIARKRKAFEITLETDGINFRPHFEALHSYLFIKSYTDLNTLENINKLFFVNDQITRYGLQLGNMVVDYFDILCRDVVQLLNIVVSSRTLPNEHDEYTENALRRYLRTHLSLTLEFLCNFVMNLNKFDKDSVEACLTLLLSKITFVHFNKLMEITDDDAKNKYTY